MFIDEITRSCSNEQVALAAVSSLGVGFSRRVGTAAAAHGLSAGAFTALSVRRFACGAGEADRNAVRRAMRGSDQPVLSGLRHIVELAIDGRLNQRRPATDGKRRACG